MVFLVTIVLQSFLQSGRVIASQIISSHTFSVIIETSTEKKELLREFNNQLGQFIKTKKELLKTEFSAETHVELASVSMVKL